MSMYGKNHYSTVISLQLIKINEKKKEHFRFTEKWKGTETYHILFAPSNMHNLPCYQHHSSQFT